MKTPQGEITDTATNNEKNSSEIADDQSPKPNYEEALELVNKGDDDSLLELINVFPRFNNADKRGIIQEAAMKGNLKFFSDLVNNNGYFQDNIELLTFAFNSPANIIEFIYNKYPKLFNIVNLEKIMEKNENPEVQDFLQKKLNNAKNANLYPEALSLVEKNDLNKLIPIFDKLKDEDKTKVVNEAAKKNKLEIFKKLIESDAKFQGKYFLQDFAKNSPLEIVKYIVDKYYKNKDSGFNNDSLETIINNSTDEAVISYLKEKLNSSKDDQDDQNYEDYQDDGTFERLGREPYYDQSKSRYDAEKDDKTIKAPKAEESFKSVLNKFKRLLQN